MDEFELIRRYFAGGPDGDGVVVGIGDDGAVVAPTPGKQIVSVIDTLVAGVHFPEDLSPADTGYRAVAVNLSDIAAMGATPRWMTLSLSLPSTDEAWLERFAEGLHSAAAEFECALVGGDTTSAPVVVTTVQIEGEVEPGQAILRSGARPGDTIYVTGTVGDAAAGLAGLEGGLLDKRLVSRFSRPSARVAYGQKLAGVATAAIDVSDGLYADLGKLLSASGVGAEVDVEKLPLSAALLEHFDVESRRKFALSGGDDYELCFTCADTPPDGGILPVTAIGTVTDDAGIVLRDADGVFDYEDRGYRHFS